MLEKQVRLKRLGPYLNTHLTPFAYVLIAVSYLFISVLQPVLLLSNDHPVCNIYYIL